MKTVVNLLPERLQQRQLLRRNVTWWAAAWAACLAVGTGAFVLQRSATRSLRIEVNAAEADFADIQAAVRNGDAVQARLQSLAQQQRQFRSLPNGHVPLSLLELLGRCARTTGGQVRLESIGVRELPEAATASSRVTIDIDGTALSDQSIGRFVGSLRTSGVFESVVLRSSRGSEGTKQAHRRFLLQCVISGEAKAESAGRKAEGGKRKAEG